MGGDAICARRGRMMNSHDMAQQRSAALLEVQFLSVLTMSSVITHTCKNTCIVSANNLKTLKYNQEGQIGEIQPPKYPNHPLL